MNEHPCANGLTPECFAAFPEWAKLAFCYKLMNVLIPANISRRLPKGLFPGRIGPGAILPAGWDPPPGVVVPPGYTVPERWIPFTYFILPEGMTWEQAFPPGWTAGDALPDGVSINANVVDVAGWSAGDSMPSGPGVNTAEIVPAGWTAGDALPDGVSINANMVDVAGWSAGDPMPSGPGVNTAAILPAGWSPTNPPPAWFAPGGAGLQIPPGGALPPLFLPPFEPGPVHVPFPAPTAPTYIEVVLTGSINDGQVGNIGLNWNTVRTATTGTQKDDFLTASIMAATCYLYGGKYAVFRSFFFFDLSAIPAGKDVFSANLSVMGFINADSSVAVQEGTQEAEITIADFDAFTGDSFGNVEWQVGRNAIEFNAAGKAYLKSMLGNADPAKLCCRELLYDIEGLIPGAIRSNGCYYRNSIAINWPKLTIVYVK